MPLVITSLNAQDRIADFLHDAGVNANLETIDDGGEEFGDMQFTAQVQASVDEDVIRDALADAPDELGPAFDVTYSNRLRQMLFLVKQPSDRQSYELETAFRHGNRVLNMPVWSARLCAFVLASGISMIIVGTLMLHNHWHPYESAYQTPMHYLGDIISVSWSLAIDLWEASLALLTLLSGLVYSWR